MIGTYLIMMLLHDSRRDTNALQEMGEASITLAQTCFGTSMTGDNGHDAADVLCKY